MLILYTMLLDEIVSHKRREVAALKARLDLPKIAKEIKALRDPRDYRQAFSGHKMALIAEVKRASPSAGNISPELDPVVQAKAYEVGGAAAISVLTDQKYFKGRIEDLEAVSKAVHIPVLRKDFIIDPAQVYESRLYGADLILLIVRILSDEELESLSELAFEMKMGCLVEVHNEWEMERALRVDSDIIGINNRDLDSLEVDLGNTSRLIEHFPELKDKIVVSESGIASGEQVRALKAKGVAAVLVGESLLKSADVASKIRELMGG